MKKILFCFTLLILFFSTSSPSFSAGYINPVLTGASWSTPISPVTNNSTSVTLLYNNQSPAPSPNIVNRACYLLGRGGDRASDGTTPKDHWPVVTDSGPAITGATGITFYEKLKDDPDVGWHQNDYAKQAGGNLCGFLNNPIPGPGDDTPADYVRTDSDGNVWFYSLCENMEGVRNDCQTRYTFDAFYSQTLFQVVCAYTDPNDPSKDVVDTTCDPNKADFQKNNQNGLRQLRICCRNTDKDVSEKWLPLFYQPGKNCQLRDGFEPANDCGGFIKLGISSVTFWDKGYFTVVADLSANNFNNYSNTVKFEFGDLPRNPADLATLVLRIALGLAGGVAFLLMVFGSFRLIFSGGNPDSVQQGRETLTAAVIGLLVVIFATFILQLVGISIFGFNI